MEKREVKMPRIGANENYVTIGQWMVKDGQWVQLGDLLAVVETTKQTQEIFAEIEGYIIIHREAGEDILTGDIIAIIAESDEQEKKEETANHSNGKEVDDVRITKKAQILAKQNGIDYSIFKSSKTIIRERDILAIIDDKSKNRKTHNSPGIIIVSGGGVAKMCVDILLANKNYAIAGITDISMNQGDCVQGIKVLGNDDVLDEKYNEGSRTAVNAVGSIANDNNSSLFNLRKNIFYMIKDKGYFLPNIIHPSAILEASVVLGEGNLIFAGAMIGSSVVIEDDCIINTGVIISHDCHVASHSRISPGAILGGDVFIGENTLIGMGVTIYLGVKVGKNVIISNGANVFSDVPDNAVI